MSDVAPRNYEESLCSLRAMRREVLFDLDLEESEMASKAFERASETVAFEGTNVSIGRLKRLTLEFFSEAARIVMKSEKEE